MNRAPLVLVIVLLLMPVLYVGSYLALVVPGPPVEGTHLTFRNRPIYRGHYRFGKEWADRFFWPAEQADRRVRPAAWDDELTRWIKEYEASHR